MLEQIRGLVKNKKVLILGFGKEGHSTYTYLQKAGGWAKLGVADQNPVELEDARVELICGDGYQSAIASYDVVFKSPGIVLEQQDAQTLCKITSQTEQFLQRFGAQTIGITGTKGKSTTASVLYHILHSSAQDCMLIGNIGVPALDMATKWARRPAWSMNYPAINWNIPNIRRTLPCCSTCFRNILTTTAPMKNMRRQNKTSTATSKRAIC